MIFKINGKRHEVDVAPDLPLLWVIREYLKLTGTKYGCGIGLCGACTVHINGNAQRSCQILARDAQDKKITTIEGLPEDHPVNDDEGSHFPRLDQLVQHAPRAQADSRVVGIGLPVQQVQDRVALVRSFIVTGRQVDAEFLGRLERVERSPLDAARLRQAGKRRGGRREFNCRDEPGSW